MRIAGRAGALATVLLSTAVTLHAQVGTLRVAGADEPVTVAVAMHQGYPAYPMWTLRTLGARVEATTRGARVTFESDTLVFELRSPIVLVDGEPTQLLWPPYRAGGIVYMPHQLFAEWLPARYPDRLDFADGTLRLLDEDVSAAPDGRDAVSAVPATDRAPEAPGAGDAAEPASSKRLVVLDAGHGGVDAGKTGPGGVREKAVALELSERLATTLRDRGYEVRLTRTADTLIALDDRPHLANEWKGSRQAALFLSIHANSVSDRRVRGFETFFLSEARTEDERRVAEMENAAVSFEDGGGSDMSEIGFIVNNLRNDFYLMASHALAQMVQSELRRFHPGPDRGVKQAGFRVLVGALMPAVLVEVAFISNPAEAELLDSAAFQRRTAAGIADAVDRFFEAYRDRLSTGG